MEEHDINSSYEFYARGFGGSREIDLLSIWPLNFHEMLLWARLRKQILYQGKIQQWEEMMQTHRVEP